MGREGESASSPLTLTVAEALPLKTIITLKNIWIVRSFAQRCQGIGMVGFGDFNAAGRCRVGRVFLTPLQIRRNCPLWMIDVWAKGGIGCA